MDEAKNQWVDVVGKLTRLTQEGQIKWHIDKPTASLIRNPSEQVNVFFKTTYLGRNLRLYERRYKEEMEQANFWPVIRRPKEREWKNEVVLEFVDEWDRAFWSFPKVNALNGLLSSVQYQVADITEFMKEVLKKE